MRSNTDRCRLTAIAGGIALSLVLAACGGTSTSTPAAAPASSAAAAPGVSTEHNAADISFIQGMIPHHQQAVEMSSLASTRAQSPEVNKLAEQIKGAQDPEIQLMLGFLQTWGAPPPPTASAGGEHGGSGGHEGSGLMSPEQISQLSNAAGAQFDQMFLQLMIAHHQGAIASSEQELAEGTNPQAKMLATQIIATQSAEITRMQQLLPIA